jgi:threonylcarbamoyladenosine tRNA methylthiotransferase MtaB
MENQIDEDLKNERVHRLIELSNQLAKEYASNFEGEVLEVIPEERDKDNKDSGLFIGYTDNYLKVKFPATEEMIGKLVKVKIAQAGYPFNHGEFVRVFEDADTKQVVNG